MLSGKNRRKKILDAENFLGGKYIVLTHPLKSQINGNTKN